MKNVQQNLKRRAGIVGMVCLLAGLLTSCSKDRHDNNYVVPPAALLSVINASPDAQPVNFFLDQNQANQFPIRYGHGLDYLRAFNGKRVATFTLAGSSTKIKSDTINLVDKKFYSIYLTNLVSKPDIILLGDSIARPDAGKATIRFVNVSPDAPAVDLGIKGGAVLAANKTYKGYSLFTPVQGDATYTLEVRKAGTATVLVSLSNITLRSGSIYTVWLHGLTAATDQTKLAADIQTNAFYY
ncbi:DUF4397 domain-containing protein [Mucilaginibacter sp. SP1R1]|uniref:DUF4397 domain-containing protein n=1 Tax=Mucilaginibacter sp. SP1R1 TaxID=2723091 RepID=UPI001616F427|nr:DUF4397 domain-containing protein [Mucilaginibacter sp. SP1R1]MBB6152007.1 hypothetical protein [Mucilaginibacter sp. SP1R1]